MMRRIESALLAVFCFAPWAWLLCTAVFAGLVTIDQGHFPSYSNPDPKHAGRDSLYLATMLLFLFALLSPLGIGAILALRALRKRALGLRGRLAFVYALGLAVAGWVAFGGAFGLMSWLLD